MSAKSLEDAVKEEETEDYNGEDSINEAVEKSAQARGKQTNISFFAFTATPKPKTLAVFGQKNRSSKPEPFHLYSMRQAIEEGFILDVLQNYTTYELYFKLSKAIKDDPELNKKKTAKAIARFVYLHPHNLAQKAEIIIEHFRACVATKIGGRAKAMVVTSSRLHAKRYFEEFNRYIKEKGYNQEIKILVAFSGKVKDSEFPDEKYPDGVSEPQLTSFGIKELPKIFEQDEFKKSLRTWTNLYSFLSQLMPFRDSELEKFLAFAKFLLTKLPKRSLAESVRLVNEVALEYYRLQKIKEGSIDLIKGEAGEIETFTEAGIKRPKDEKAPLSIIIDKLNDRFGTEFEEADRLFFEQIESELVKDEALKIQAKANKLDTFKFVFEETFIDKLIERMEQNQEIFEKILEDRAFGGLVKELMMKNVYQRLNQDDPGIATENF